MAAELPPCSVGPLTMFSSRVISGQLWTRGHGCREQAAVRSDNGSHPFSAMLRQHSPFLAWSSKAMMIIIQPHACSEHHSHGPSFTRSGLAICRFLCGWPCLLAFVQRPRKHRPFTRQDSLAKRKIRVAAPCEPQTADIARVHAYPHQRPHAEPNSKCEIAGLSWGLPVSFA